MDLSLGVHVQAATVFLQGLLSFFSPCVLPLLPLYMGYLSGGTVVRDEEGQLHFDRKKVLCNTLFFVLGVSFAFFLLGFGMTAVGHFFGGNQLLFARIGGVLVILFGLYQLGVFGQVAALISERRLPFAVDKMAMSPLAALLMGFVFSFAWTPCVGPTLSGVLIMAASASSDRTGYLLIGVYTLGFVIPFLLAGLFTTSLLSVFRRHRNVVRYTVKIGGALMVLMGILMLTGRMNSISGYLANLPGGAGNGGVRTDSTEKELRFEEDTEELTGAYAPGNASSAESAQTEALAQAGEEAQTEVTLYPAPDFTLTDQYGEPHTLSDYRGKLVFLNFWATWCPPCRAEMPDIQALYEEQDAEDPALVILGVAFPGHSGEGSAEDVAAFLEENGYTYPTVMDEAGTLMGQYYITAFPTTFMIDPEGNMLGYIPGSMTRDIMDSVIGQSREYVAAHSEGAY